MTLVARRTLEDCRSATADLVEGKHGFEWRRSWILAVVLLRAVGHVLHNVDGAQSEQYRRAVDTWWKTLRTSKPEPAIFWCFIEEERNAILKEYQTVGGEGISIRVPLAHLNLADGTFSTTPPLPTLYHHQINSGPFKGMEQRELLQVAIDWWQQELDKIDLAASAA